jgi:hypothetical protein
MPNNFDNDVASAHVRLVDIEQRSLSFRSIEHCFIEGLFIPIS